jgi:hypothetical protein
MAQFLFLGASTTSGAVNLFFVGLAKALVANGWTEHDVISSSPGSRDVVFKSTPLDVTADNSCYLRIRQTALTSLLWNIYSDWDQATDTGANEASTGTPISLLDTSFLVAARINPYSVALFFRVSISRAYAYAGYLRRGLPASKAGFTKTTSAYSAGTVTVSVASSMIGKLKVGQKVMIYNHVHNSTSPNFGNAETAYISAIAAGSITFTSGTTKAYDSGAVIGQSPMPVVTPLAYATGSNEGAQYLAYYMSVALDGSRVSATTHTAAGLEQLFSETSNDPGDIYLDIGIGFCGISANETNKTGFLGHLYHFECAAAPASGVALHGDDINDGSNSFMVVGVNVTSDMFLMGPR